MTSFCKMTSEPKCQLLNFDKHGNYERCNNVAKKHCFICAKDLCGPHKPQDVCYGCCSLVDEEYFLPKRSDHSELKSLRNRNDLPKANSVYLHYKGSLYTVITTAYLEKNQEIHVVYSDGSLDFIVPLKEWKEQVKHNGKLVPRFKLN